MRINTPCSVTFASVRYFCENREKKIMKSLSVERRMGERVGATSKEIREIQKYVNLNFVSLRDRLTLRNIDSCLLQNELINN